MAGHRQPADEEHREHECRDERLDPVEQPGEEDEREHEREGKGHHDERMTEPRLRERREVAVEESPERQLQRVLRAERERGDSRLQREHRPCACEHGDPPLEVARDVESSQHDQAQAERADREREPDEPQPTHDVLLHRRPAGAVGRGHRGRGHADAERPHARDDVRVRRDRDPAHGVRAERKRAYVCDELGSLDSSRPGEVLADPVQDAQRTGQRRDGLVEVQANRVRAPAAARCRSAGAVDTSVA